MDKDLFFMEKALERAVEAGRRGEVPIGAALVSKGFLVAADGNRREELKDATAHAEILVLRRAGKILGGWRLPNSTLYVTVEPCPMCAGALVAARVGRLVYGAADPKGGAVVSLYNITTDERLNHRLLVTGGVLEERCAGLMREFFRLRRGT